MAARRSLSSCAARPSAPAAARGLARTLGITQQPLGSPPPLRRHVPILLSWLQGLWRSLGPKASAPTTEFVELSEHRTELRHGHMSFVLDTRSKLITRNGHEFVRFDQIRTIDLIHMREDDDSPVRWGIQLNTGPLSSKTVLVTTDDADASIVGARLSTLTGKSVRSL